MHTSINLLFLLVSLFFSIIHPYRTLCAFIYVTQKPFSYRIHWFTLLVFFFFLPLLELSRKCERRKEKFPEWEHIWSYSQLGRENIYKKASISSLSLSRPKKATFLCIKTRNETHCKNCFCLSLFVHHLSLLLFPYIVSLMHEKRTQNQPKSPDTQKFFISVNCAW